jgi:hypothetical protein
MSAKRRAPATRGTGHDCVERLRERHPADSPLGLTLRAWPSDPDEPLRAAEALDGLRQLRALRAHIAEREDELARAARGAGASWQQLAEAVGVTRQRMQQRWGGRAGRADARPEPAP